MAAANGAKIATKGPKLQAQSTKANEFILNRGDHEEQHLHHQSRIDVSRFMLIIPPAISSLHALACLRSLLDTCLQLRFPVDWPQAMYLC